MKILYSTFCCFAFIFLFPYHGFSESDSCLTRIGFSYSIGKQQMFPFNSRDYLYNVRGYKMLINRQISSSKFSFEFQAEPSLYFADHQLLEELFIQPSDGPDYMEKRSIFTKMKTITELALNFGVIIRYNFNPVGSLYLIGSIGPMYSDTETERLAKGFAFSDIAGIGTSVRIKKILFDFRTGIRHVSNADLNLPNSGHNSTTIDFGLSYYLDNLSGKKKSKGR